tara:strand:+ start:905 stop:2092 length:1188 start_codon:yes stop_codon:yes gene_type:complete
MNSSNKHSIFYTSSIHHLVFGIFFFMGIGLFSNAYAQATSNQLEFGASAGRVIRHNAKFKPVVNGPSFLYQLSWVRHRNDSLTWRKAANFPRVGLTLIFADCAPNDVFGYGIGLSPFIDFTLRQRPKSQLDLRLGTGLAYFTEAYDPVSNPENNVIGSHLNTIVHLGIHHQWILNSLLSLGQGIDLIHFSNARSTSPNLGINTVAAKFSVRYTLTKQSSRERLSTPRSGKKANEGFRPHSISLRYGLGLTDRFVGGPVRPVHSSILQYMHSTGLLHSIGLGFKQSWDIGELEALNFLNQGATRIKLGSASNASVFIADAWRFGTVGLELAVGAYLYDRSMTYDRLWFKIGIQGFLGGRNRGTQGIAGCHMKSHYAVAEYVELQSGVQFNYGKTRR